FLSHSGSAFAAFAFNDRGIGFDLLVSSGQEVVTPMDAYLRFALERDTTRVIAMLLETVRNPDGFRAALARAAERDVPVFALTVGRTEASKALVVAHSGALAGEHGAYEAVFDAYGVHEVRSLDEVGAMAFVVDLTRQGEPYDEGYLQVARDVWTSTTKPFCVLSNLSAAVAADEARMLRDDGIPVLEGTTPGLRALKHLLDDATWRAGTEPQPPQPAPEVTRRSQRDLLGAATSFSEAFALRMLAGYGIATV